MEAICRKSKLLRALTSLDAGKFARLLTVFEQASQARRGRFNRFGAERRRARGHRQRRRARHAQGAVLLRAFLLQVLSSLAGSDGRALRFEPTAGVPVTTIRS